MKGVDSLNNRGEIDDDGFTDLVFSWSLEDIFNDNLYRNQVKMIPESFESAEKYFGAFVYPLLEETRAELSSSMEIMSGAPYAEVTSLVKAGSHGKMLYDIKVDCWKHNRSEYSKEQYRTLPGDILVLSNVKPKTVADLQQLGSTWTLASITEDENEDGASSTHFKVKVSSDTDIKDGLRGSLFAVFLVNITTSRRIWKSLHISGNLKIIEGVLCHDFKAERDGGHCCALDKSRLSEEYGTDLLSKLNKSQVKAIWDSLYRMQCDHMSLPGLIWGPPGTGKTKTVGVMLFTLLKMNLRVLTCAPTDVAINEVVSCVLKLVRESSKAEVGSLGDILLFGNNGRLEVHSDVYLDSRAELLAECLGPLTGWRHCFNSMRGFLKDCISQYDTYVENELLKQKESSRSTNKNKAVKTKFKSFLEFVRANFKSYEAALKRCIHIMCTHLPKSYFLKHHLQYMQILINSLDNFGTLILQDNLVSEELEKAYRDQDAMENFSTSSDLTKTRSKCLSDLKNLEVSLEDLGLPSVMNKKDVMDFCFQTASLIFCTASSSFKLQSVVMKQLDLLIIDEASQLKESESTIPLQLPGLKHAILVGDEFQLPAMVKSEVSTESGYGRSLFERLSLLGHVKHHLNMQYRMHPAISIFPNSKFYFKKISDAHDVQLRSYENHYLPGPMFGPYSFINVIGGREEKDHFGHSLKNMVEVAIVIKIVENLYKGWKYSNKNIRIGVISPFAAQVVAIQDKLAGKYDNHDGFTVKVGSVDWFQGGEEDVIIISSVRSNCGGPIGFLSIPQRTNVALTRARHCLWILGNERTLSGSGSVWEEVILDSKNRKCFFSADEDKDIAKAIIDVKKELDQLDNLLIVDKMLLKHAYWKVLLSDNFRKSFGNLNSKPMKKSVLNLLLKLSNGWRPKTRNEDSACHGSSWVLKQFKVEGVYVVCTIDIIKESTQSRYIQVLRVWDLLALAEIPKLMKRLDNMFVRYTEDFIKRCNEKRLVEDLELPKSWSSSLNIVRRVEDDSSGRTIEERSYVENSKVTESLLLMKFYPLSSGAISHLLSNRDGKELELPFEMSDQEKKTISFPTSCFILGRSGTGKTTALTMKLFEKEKQFHEVTNESPRHDVGEGRVGTRGKVLRQLFVTASHKLCYAIKQHVNTLNRSIIGENLCSIDMVDTNRLKDIPDSFVDISSDKYPLVVTFHKFLLMLDGSVGISFFERFPELRELSHCKTICSTSVALEKFIRTKEVTYDRFCSIYWPHFNSQLTKKLDSSKVFTEIISCIKGALGEGGTPVGKINQEAYVLLSEGRISTLSKQKRERIYCIFQDYEKKKMENGDFDLADLVNDLHHRLRNERFEGNEMDFVYVDEVQDLTMRQIALFKYICRNVDEGFTFAGDTAQTIARGIDFRFEDIRSLFYNHFMLESTAEGCAQRREKGQLSETLSLTQNFRTHDGVLRLAQSVIDLLYRFFRNSVDVLEPERSYIYGEAPVLIASQKEENAITTIFGNSGNVNGNIVGFGAEQVILVRDDSTRKAISEFVGKQALVLTILECKGLEFQDVLLYNFFGSSPLKSQWRVVYGFMEEQELLDATIKSFPPFSQARHNLLCSELKQLYVAITRTRQRLWICENKEVFSKPMFDYWKKKCLVQVRELDGSLAKDMQVASSPEEWIERGIKLFHEDHYEMAKMCFERAGDPMWEKRAKAGGLRADANRICGSNPEKANSFIRQAAELYESIDMAESAAECYYELTDYERAGKIYMDRCGEAQFIKAGECFSKAGRHDLAADVYARGNYFSECLSVCTKGNLFDVGLQYIQSWKQHDMKAEQEFLESCALHLNELGNKKGMMKFVRSFRSVELKCKFLKSLNCLDELLVIEEESGNCLEALELVKLKGDALLEAEVLGKARNFKDASMLILWHVFHNSIWVSIGKGWPLKQFPERKELLERAKSFAIKESQHFYEFVCTEVNILSNDQATLFELNQYLTNSRRDQSIRGEFLSIRKIIDIHLHSSNSKFEWEDGLVVDLVMHSEERAQQNQVTVGTLACFWNAWKEKVENIFRYLGGLESQEVTDYKGYDDFCLNYFGVRKQPNDLSSSYLLLNGDADWVREIDERFLLRSGKLVYTDALHFSSAALSYLRLEFRSVGLKVLDTLKALHKYSTNNKMSLFHQSMPLLYIFEISKFLMDFKNLDLRLRDIETLQNLLKLSATKYFENVFPLDWQKNLAENMISLRENVLSRKLLEEVIMQNIGSKGKLSNKKIGMVVMTWLGSGKPSDEVCNMIVSRLKKTPKWGEFIDDLIVEVDMPETPTHVPLVFKFYFALEYAFSANWMDFDNISPSCSLYLLDRLLLIGSCLRGFVFTTKSSFVEWVISGQPNRSRTARISAGKEFKLGRIFDFVALVIRQIYSKQALSEWIKKSNLNCSSYRLLVLRLAVIQCLLCLNCGRHMELLHEFLGRSELASCLPRQLYDVLKIISGHNIISVNAVAEAFKIIGDPLVMVRLEENCPKLKVPDDVVSVDMRPNYCKEDVMRKLFSVSGSKHPCNETLVLVDPKPLYSREEQRNTSKLEEMDRESVYKMFMEESPVARQCIPEILSSMSEAVEAFKSVGDGRDKSKFKSAAAKLKAAAEKGITSLVGGAIADSLTDRPFLQGLHEFNSMLEDINQFSDLVNSGEPEHCRRRSHRKLRRPALESSLNKMSEEAEKKGEVKSMPPDYIVSSSLGPSKNSEFANVETSKGRGNQKAKKKKKTKKGKSQKKK